MIFHTVKELMNSHDAIFWITGALCWPLAVWITWKQIKKLKKEGQ